MGTQMITRVFTRLGIEGLHHFPAAASDPTLRQVAFLSDPHRHIFGISVWIGVRHDDRDIEFITLKRWLGGVFGAEPVDFGTRSCEAIARELHQLLSDRYPGRSVTVCVDEDGESGAEVSS